MSEGVLERNEAPRRVRCAVVPTGLGGRVIYWKEVEEGGKKEGMSVSIRLHSVVVSGTETLLIHPANLCHDISSHHYTLTPSSCIGAISSSNLAMLQSPQA